MKKEHADILRKSKELLYKLSADLESLDVADIEVPLIAIGELVSNCFVLNFKKEKLTDVAKVWCNKVMKITKTKGGIYGE